MRGEQNIQTLSSAESSDLIPMDIKKKKFSLCWGVYESRDSEPGQERSWGCPSAANVSTQQAKPKLTGTQQTDRPLKTHHCSPANGQCTPFRSAECGREERVCPTLETNLDPNTQKDID